jgi:hypothetical protein
MARKIMLSFAALGIAAISMFASAGSAAAHGPHWRYRTFAQCEHEAALIRDGQTGAWCTRVPSGGAGSAVFPWVLHVVG